MKEILVGSAYEVMAAKIIAARNMTQTEKYFKIELPNHADLNHTPGQFVMVSLPGIGEAPISISSSPTQKGYFELVIRKAGKLTDAIHKLSEGSALGIRGPFGTGFPFQKFEGNDLFFICGGLGLVPLRSLINFVIDNRKDFGKIHILIGCKTPIDLLFSAELTKWAERTDINYSCTVDKADPDWKGNIGVITSLIPGVTLDIAKTFAVVCGPPIMYKFVIAELVKKGLGDEQIYLSLERHMKCGIGKCGHCQINNLYCCKDGPVLNYKSIKNLREAI